jgi:hypothetical protein
MVRGSNPDGGEVFRSSPETRLTFLTMGAGCLSPGVALSTHSLLAPKVPKGHRCTYIHPLCLYGMLQSEVCLYSTITFLHFPTAQLCLILRGDWHVGCTPVFTWRSSPRILHLSVLVTAAGIELRTFQILNSYISINLVIVFPGTAVIISRLCEMCDVLYKL